MGDFSRMTFDPQKHYSSVRMQQGRVQLDSDWNEQMDIVRHYLETHMQDLIGPGGTSETASGFAITLSTASDHSAQEHHVRDSNAAGGHSSKRMPDFSVSEGRYYVDGIVCENDSRMRFTQQPDYPDATLPAEMPEGTQYLVYLDTWQRDITAIEDPDLREVALGGPDTTTRTKTVWQVKLLPLGSPAAREHEHDDHDPGSLPEWKSLIARHTFKGLMKARCNHSAYRLENQLYRVEIHSADNHSATFKWSRENGSVTFPITGISTAAEGKSCVVTLDGLGRDKQSLQVKDWVEIADDDSDLSDDNPWPLYEIASLDPQVTLRAPSPLQDDDERKRFLTRHPLLRRWDQKGVGVNDRGVLQIPAHADAENWLTLENGVQVCFTGDGTYHPGNYWLIPSRTQTGDIEWPHDDSGSPLARPPYGIQHHLSPLALLHWREGEWKAADLRHVFDPLPAMSAHSKKAVKEAETMRAALERVEATVKTCAEAVESLKQGRDIDRSRLFQDLMSSEALEVGDVVSLDPDKEGHVVQTNKENETLVLGVVTEIGPDHAKVRVTLYGRAQCQVIRAVQPGDLLVPSQLKGCAQAGGVYLRPGTIIGKALSPYQPDQADQPGMVEVLVTLG
jgi:hypothetical protein